MSSLSHHLMGSSFLATARKLSSLSNSAYAVANSLGLKWIAELVKAFAFPVLPLDCCVSGRNAVGPSGRKQPSSTISQLILRVTESLLTRFA